MAQIDMIDAAKLALQIGIRRGSLDLVKTTFDILWQAGDTKKWLLWRIPIIVAEDVWYMASELASFINAKKYTEKSWLRLLYTLTLVPKAKDAEALFYMDTTPFQSYAEIQLADKYFNMLDGSKTGPLDIVNMVLDEYYKTGRLFDYEKEAINMLKMRIYHGGVYYDRCCCAAAIMLIISRGLNKQVIQVLIENSVKKYKESHLEKPKTVEFDWSVYCPLTKVGTAALTVYEKKYQKEKPLRINIFSLWNFLLAKRIPLEGIRYAKPAGNLIFSRTYWWLYYVKERLIFNNRTAKENKVFWESTVQPRIKEIIEELVLNDVIGKDEKC